MKVALGLPIKLVAPLRVELGGGDPRRRPEPPGQPAVAHFFLWTGVPQYYLPIVVHTIFYDGM